MYLYRILDNLAMPPAGGCELRRLKEAGVKHTGLLVLDS